MPDAAAPSPTTRRLLWVGFYLLLAFSFLGSRPIWDPDEGRYTNVALHMLERGDFIHPMRSDEVGHWTKPPLTYWAIAASIGTFGRNAWAARLPAALAFLACVFLVGRMARRLAPGREGFASLALATMTMPLGAVALITTDYLLTAMLALGMWGYVEARFGDPSRSRRRALLMWVGFGLAFLTKGPPALLPWLAIAALELFGNRRRGLPLFALEGPLLFGVLAFGWFALVTVEQPALLNYFLGQEVAKRIAGDGFGRNSQWYGWLLVYAPTVLLGSLPWTWRLLKSLGETMGMLRGWWARRTDASLADEARFLTLAWLALPLLVLCLASSRLPLYALPLFLPIALIVAQYSTKPRVWWPRLLTWVAGLLALRLLAAHWPTSGNAEEWANEIIARAPGPVHEVVFVDDKPRYGVHLYIDAEVEKVALKSPDMSDFGRIADHSFVTEVLEREPGVLYVAESKHYPRLARAAARVGMEARLLGEPHRGRRFFIVVPAKPVPAGPDDAPGTPASEPASGPASQAEAPPEPNPA